MSAVANYIYQDGLETARLRTRWLTEADCSIWSDFFKDEEAKKFLPAFGLSEDKDRAKHMIEKQLARYSDNRFGLQALTDKSTGDFIGMCGLLLQEVDGMPEVEVGYHLFKKHWGKGFATEAAIKFREYGFEKNLASSIVSIIDIENFRSQKVAVKNGMQREKQLIWNDMDIFVYRIHKPVNR